MAKAEPSQSASQAEDTDVKPGLSEKIQVQVEFEGRSVKFALKRTALVRKVFAAAATAFNMDAGSLRFAFRGKRLRPEDDDTPDSLDMDDGDTIDAHVQQVGGFL
ncbi:ubiquitin-like protein [Dentipellis sp. KUC8613]|nr:ubiquitin-like protein [Dentipellis sp. KUC8613]